MLIGILQKGISKVTIDAPYIAVTFVYIIFVLIMFFFVNLALLYNLRVYIQIFALVGGTSRRRVAPYKIEYLYIHEFLHNKIHLS